MPIQIDRKVQDNTVWQRGVTGRSVQCVERDQWQGGVTGDEDMSSWDAGKVSEVKDVKLFQNLMLGQWTASVNHANVLTLVYAGLSVNSVLPCVFCSSGKREIESTDNLQEALRAISYSPVHFLSPLQCPPPCRAWPPSSANSAWCFLLA